MFAQSPLSRTMPPFTNRVRFRRYWSYRALYYRSCHLVRFSNLL